MNVIPRPAMRRAIVLLPNGFTLGNLFFGIYAIVSATRGEFPFAGTCVVLSGLMDALDGRVARMTRTTSRFGVELDSLVDAVSFGVAPAFIAYFAMLTKDSWAWLTCFIYVACVVMRLARFNIEQGGRAKTQFHGLPSPAAGMTIATYCWFATTPLYTNTVIGTWPWHTLLPGVMLVLSFLMISHVLYPALPTVSVRSVRSVIGSVFVLAILGLAIYRPAYYAFPAMMVYVTYGLARTILLGIFERPIEVDPLNDDEDDEDDEGSMRPAALAERPGGRGRRRRFRGVREAMNPFHHPPEGGA
jgi:CDP-diacylglycerol---serine O-phosphatidyltransferase